MNMQDVEQNLREARGALGVLAINISLRLRN